MNCSEIYLKSSWMSLRSEGDHHLVATGWDIADSYLDFVEDPFHKVPTTLVLCVESLLIHFLHKFLPMEESSVERY